VGVGIAHVSGARAWALAHYEDHQGAWWCIVRPIGASIGAWWKDGQKEPNIAISEQRSAIGKQLYEYVRPAPTFCYALY
jgi:hypothetical protein